MNALEQLAMWIILGAVAILVGMVAWLKHKLQKRDEESADRLLESIERRAKDEIDNLSDDELLHRFNKRFPPK